MSKYKLLFTVTGWSKGVVEADSEKKRARRLIAASGSRAEAASELNPWADAEWVVAITADNLLIKHDVAVNGSPFVHLVPVTGHRMEEIKRDSLGIGDLAISAAPPMSFGAIKLNALLAHALKTGCFGPTEDQA